MKIAVLIDSGSNYFGEQIQEEGLFCVPLQVIDGDKGYREGVEISSLETYKLIEDGKMLKTSSPLVSDVEDMFDHIKECGYDAVFGVNITSGLSSTISMVNMVATDKGMPFDYFDCYTTARVQLQCALKALSLFKEGYTFEEVKPILQDVIDHSKTYVLPVDMNHLVRGGRLTPLAAKFAGLLKINPILYLNQSTGGKNESFKKVRTQKKAFETVVDDMVSEGVNSDYKICVTHVKDIQAGQTMLEMIKSSIPNADIYLVDLVPVVGVHTGIGAVAIQYVKK